jgi:hypothetical protein
MVDAKKTEGSLPALLVMIGLLSVAAGFYSGGPDTVGGIVFGVLALAAAAAIHHRRSHDAKARSKAETADR